MAERNRGKQRRSESHPWGWQQNWWGWRPPPPPHRDSGGGGGGGASGAGVAHGAAEGATFVLQPKQLAAALAEATEGEGTAREDVQRGVAPVTTKT